MKITQTHPALTTNVDLKSYPARAFAGFAHTSARFAHIFTLSHLLESAAAVVQPVEFCGGIVS